MRRIFFSVVFAAAGIINSHSQTMQASLGVGDSPSRIKIYIKPIGNVNGTISTIQFDVAISQSITPVPTLSVVGTPALGLTWQVSSSYLDSGYRHYDLTTAGSPSLVLSNGVELEMMQLQLSGGPATPNNVLLYTLPEGGATTGNGLFYCSGAANSDPAVGLYYVRGGVTVVNKSTSYSPGGESSYASISGIILLPIKWLSFNAVKQNSDALINWTVSDEETNHHYELQRSLNGIDFSTIATINKNGVGSGVHDYAYTDLNIISLGSTFIYYRLKQIDIDGRSSYSDIRKINIRLRNDLITVYPNPVTEGFYVVIPGLQANTERNIKLVLTANSGQVVQTREISSVQASNYYFDVKELILAAGVYSLQIIHNGVLLERKQLLISK